MKQAKRILALVLALMLALPTPVYTADDSTAETGIVQEESSGIICSCWRWSFVFCRGCA